VRKCKQTPLPHREGFFLSRKRVEVIGGKEETTRGQRSRLGSAMQTGPLLCLGGEKVEPERNIEGRSGEKELEA